MIYSSIVLTIEHKKEKKRKKAQFTHNSFNANKISFKCKLLSLKYFKWQKSSTRIAIEISFSSHDALYLSLNILCNKGASPSTEGLWKFKSLRRQVALLCTTDCVRLEVTREEASWTRELGLCRHLARKEENLHKRRVRGSGRSMRWGMSALWVLGFRFKSLLTHFRRHIWKLFRWGSRRSHKGHP